MHSLQKLTPPAIPNCVHGSRFKTNRRQRLRGQSLLGEARLGRSRSRPSLKVLLVRATLDLFCERRQDTRRTVARRCPESPAVLGSYTRLRLPANLDTEAAAEPVASKQPDQGKDCTSKHLDGRLSATTAPLFSSTSILSLSATLVVDSAPRTRPHFAVRNRTSTRPNHLLSGLED